MIVDPHREAARANWRSLVAALEPVPRHLLPLWKYRLHEGWGVVLRPTAPSSRAVFTLVLGDATRRENAVPALDVPRSRVRVFLGGDREPIEETEIPNALVLRYATGRQAMRTTVVPAEWLAEEDGPPAYLPEHLRAPDDLRTKETR